jgi:hypothetical protein
MSTKEFAAIPAYSRGEKVAYTDNHGRRQNGHVISIEAHWSSFRNPDKAPLVIYRVTHPTYRNNETTVTPNRIFGDDA